MTQRKQFSFTKMQGAGNDFIVHDLRTSRWTIDQLVDWTPELCDRRYGIGADGLLAMTESDTAAYRMVYRNADGSDAGMCGNGGRCLALYAASKGWAATHHFEVHGQTYKAVVRQPNQVTLNFPVESQVEPLPDSLDGYQVDTGTEHIVLPVKKQRLQDLDFLQTRGYELRYHSFFQPTGTNVNFIHGINSQSLELQTYERGVENVTLACGTGAMASALVWHHLKSRKSGAFSYNIHTQGGQLEVLFTFDPASGKYSNLKLGGPAHFVFEGTIQL